MPFDAMLLRALEQRWQSSLVGMEFYSIVIDDSGSLWLSGRDPKDGHTARLLIVLTPGLARMHFTLRDLPGKSRKRTIPGFLQRLLPFTVASVSVPAFERWIRLEITHLDDLEQPVERTIIVELAGHLTNLIVLKGDNIILDALKRVAPDRPGRSVWPGDAYTPPPSIANPCETHQDRDLTPWAKIWKKANPGWAWQQFCDDWARGDYQFYRLVASNPKPGANSNSPEVWIYPQPGYQATLATDPEATLDEVFTEQERRRRIQADTTQLRRLWEQRISHLQEKIAEFRAQAGVDPEPWRNEADLWLGYQYQFQHQNLPYTVPVPTFDDSGETVALTLYPGETPWQRAEDLYRQVRKQKSRQGSLNQMIPQLETELQALQSQMHLLNSENQNLEWIRHHLNRAQKTYASPNPDESHPYRRFSSNSGHAILVGRSRTENANLTFRTARPDDLWFHVKQSPGSHVILSCGKTHPSLEDLLDAAELAVFYSQAARSSMVPVDYTRRKHVRKRPHGEPGQVLYREEKTLYITPDPDRLRRLGAIREKLGDKSTYTPTP